MESSLSDLEAASPHFHTCEICNVVSTVLDKVRDKIKQSTAQRITDVKDTVRESMRTYRWLNDQCASSEMKASDFSTINALS